MKVFVSPSFHGVSTQLWFERIAMYPECLIGIDVAHRDSEPIRSSAEDKLYWKRNSAETTELILLTFNQGPLTVIQKRMTGFVIWMDGENGRPKVCRHDHKRNHFWI